MKNRFKKFGIKNNRGGFTLIELLISIVLFMIFLGIASQSYISIVRSQRQANEVRKMYSDVRSFMDFMSEEIRLGSIDYNCYGSDDLGFDENKQKYCLAAGKSISGGETESLMLIKKNGEEKTLIDFDHGKVTVTKYYRDSIGNWRHLTGYENKVMLADRVEVTDLRFMIFPDKNPYVYYYDNEVQFQPKVTVMMSVSNAEGVSTPFNFDFQTTISSRVYSKKI